MLSPQIARSGQTASYSSIRNTSTQTLSRLMMSDRLNWKTKSCDKCDQTFWEKVAQFWRNSPKVDKVCPLPRYSWPILSIVKMWVFLKITEFRPPKSETPMALKSSSTPTKSPIWSHWSFCCCSKSYLWTLLCFATLRPIKSLISVNSNGNKKVRLRKPTQLTECRTSKYTGLGNGQLVQRGYVIGMNDTSTNAIRPNWQLPPFVND